MTKYPVSARLQRVLNSHPPGIIGLLPTIPANAIAYISHQSNGMAKESNIVHQYFKKQFDDFTVLVKVDPIQLKGTEITIDKSGSKEMRHLNFDEEGYSTPDEILEDLKADGFEIASPLEFNLYYSGLT